jgi:DNA-binding MurR/RpiR family transcriptional regulator
VLDLLQSRFDALSPELQRAARWVQAHPAEVGLHSMRECARRAEVAPATMTRLAQALGLGGFEDLRAPFRERLVQGRRYAARALSLQRERAQAAQWLGELGELQQANAASVVAGNTRAAIEAAARSMLAAPRVAFLGLRASHAIAYHLHYGYQLLAINGVLLGDVGGTLQDQIDQVARGEMLVAVSIAPYTRATVLAVEQCARRGVRVLGLTDSALSPIARPATAALLFHTESSSFFQSMVGALALSEALIAAVAACGGAKVLRRLHTMQSRLEAQNAYWERGRAHLHHTRRGASTPRAALT